MAHVKEPHGVDFVIKSRPLTKDEEIAISTYIRSYKEKHAHKQDTGAKRKRRTIAKKKATSER